MQKFRRTLQSIPGCFGALCKLVWGFEDLDSRAHFLVLGPPCKFAVCLYAVAPPLSECYGTSEVGASNVW